MEYKGHLFGKVGKHYFPLMATSEDFENLQNRVKELEAELQQIKNGEIRESDKSNCNHQWEYSKGFYRMPRRKCKKCGLVQI